jgi:histone H2A
MNPSDEACIPISPSKEYTPSPILVNKLDENAELNKNPNTNENDQELEEFCQEMQQYLPNEDENGQDEAYVPDEEQIEAENQLIEENAPAQDQQIGEKSVQTEAQQEEHVVINETPSTEQNEQEVERVAEAVGQSIPESVASSSIPLTAKAKKQQRGKQLQALLQERRKSGNVAKPVRKSKRAGLIFPVERYLKMLKKSFPHKRIQTGAAVYLTSVIEYLVAEMLELAGEMAYKMGRINKNKGSVIKPSHIMLCIEHDQEIKTLLSGVHIPHSNFSFSFWWCFIFLINYFKGSVVPNIHPRLLEAASEQGQREIDKDKQRADKKTLVYEVENLDGKEKSNVFDINKRLEAEDKEVEGVEERPKKKRGRPGAGPGGRKLTSEEKSERASQARKRKREEESKSRAEESDSSQELEEETPKRGKMRT